MAPSKLHELPATKIFQTALDTARRTRRSDAYREAAHWANQAAAEAPYGSKETYWALAEELGAMADSLARTDGSSHAVKQEVAQAIGASSRRTRRGSGVR